MEPGRAPVLFRRSGLKKPALVSLQHQGREHAGGIGAGVDADAVGPQLRFLGNGVAVHHQLAEIGVARQEFVANPHQVLPDLVRYRHAGAQARMHEEIVAFLVRQLHAAQEFEMILRHLALEIALGANQLRLRGHQPGRAHAVAFERRHPAIGEPMRAALHVGEELQQDVLVIAHDGDFLETGIPHRPAQQQLDHALGFRPPVDVIAKINEGFARGFGRGCILLDEAQQALQQVEPAVHVADRVNAASRRHRGAGLAARQLVGLGFHD